MVTKIWKISQKIGYNSDTKQGVFGIGEFNCVSEICLRATCVAMVTKIWKFWQKICYNWASIGDVVLIPGDATSRRLHCGVAKGLEIAK